MYSVKVICDNIQIFNSDLNPDQYLDLLTAEGRQLIYFLTELGFKDIHDCIITFKLSFKILIKDDENSCIVKLLNNAVLNKQN